MYAISYDYLSPFYQHKLYTTQIIPVKDIRNNSTYLEEDSIQDLLDPL